MCMLIFKPANVALDPADLSNAWADNNDGGGFAFVESGAVKIEKGYFLESEFLADVARLRDYPAIVHLRFATHGSRDESNCHPFDLQSDGAFAHNGIIPGMGGAGIHSYQWDWQDTPHGKVWGRKAAGPTKSDTAEFVEKYLIGLDYRSMRRARKAIAAKIGAASKAVSLHANGRALIYNAAAGHWRRGAWFSNYGYLPRLPVAGYGAGLGGGWSWDSEDERGGAYGTLDGDSCRTDATMIALPVKHIGTGIHSYTDAEWRDIEARIATDDFGTDDPLETLETLSANGTPPSRSAWLDWAMRYYGKDDPETRTFLENYADEFESSEWNRLA